MKILLVAGVDISLPGGVETHVRELARGLAARGHDVSIHARFSRDRKGPRLPMVDAVDPARYDVVHHHGGPWSRRWTAGVRYLRTFHFSVAAKMAVYLRMGRLRTLFHPGNHRALAEERASLRRGTLHIAVSRALREELVRFHGAARESVVAIPNGASFEAPREGRAAWRRRHDVPEEAPLLLSIGRDDYVKGTDLLLRAWETPGGHPRGAVWVQVGGRRAERRADRIATGPIAPEEVNEWIHASDVGAFPSHYEGGGIALTDMLAGGLYVLSHAVGVAPEAIRPGENGEIVPRRADAWTSALARVLAKPPRSDAPGLAADWSWESMAAKVEAVYARLPRNASP